MYEEFAGIYDRMMEEIPYEDWFRKLHSFLREKGVTSGTICDLGCGTGMMTELFAGAGYDMIGVDLSADMLAQAQEKKEQSGLEILYVQQDMTELNLLKTVNVVMSLCDSINYLLDEQDMRETFLRVYDALLPGGIFLFDLKTAYCFQEIIGNQVRVEQEEDMTCIWENYFYEEEMVNEYSLTIFRKEPESDLFSRSEEVHEQRAYDVTQVQKWLEECGFTSVMCLDTNMKKMETAMCERIYFVAQRP